MMYRRKLLDFVSDFFAFQRERHVWSALKKSYVTPPARATFAVEQANELLLHFKAGYSKRFLEAHRTEITLHKAAKAAFDEANLKKLPKVKELDAEYSKLLTEKKASYPDYRKAKEEMQELLRAKRNVELFFAEEKKNIPKTHSR